MSDPKTTADLARALDPILYPHLNPLTQGWQRLMQITLQVRTVFQAAGWVSPEEHQAAVDAQASDAYTEHLRVMEERAEKAEASLRESDAALQVARAYATRFEALAEVFLARARSAEVDASRAPTAAEGHAWDGNADAWREASDEVASLAALKGLS